MTKLQPADKSTYFPQHANKPAPNLHTKPATVKNIKRPAATPDGPKQSNYSSEQQQRT
jgi:hypothetical protein